jgi:hypothetical protein
MRIPRRLLKTITFVCFALVTALLLVVMDSTSIAQVNRTPGGEIFPDPVTTPSPSPTFRIRDGAGRTSVRLEGTWLLPVPTANANLSIPIVANPDVATVPYEQSRSIPVLSNDLGEGLTIIEVSRSDAGTTKINSDGTITYSFDPSRNSNTDRFSYTIRDRYGRTATGVVFIELFQLNTRR